MSNDKVKSAAAVASAFLLVLAVGTVGWAMLRPNPSSDTLATWKNAAVNGSVTPTPTVTPEPPPTTPPPTPTPTPKATPSKTTKKNVIPKPTSTATPRANDKPPDPEKGGTLVCLPSNLGTDAPREEVRDALVAAGNRQYWVGVVKDPNLTKPLPKITVPPDLMKAIAFQESSWRSAVQATDCGMGVMQIQADTKTDTTKAINNRFGEDFDFNKLADNAAIGAAQIEWLIMYFGIYHYDQNFALDTVAPVGPGGAEVMLLDAVLAAYNAGYGSVEQGDVLAIQDAAVQQYVNKVKALRTTCECQNW